MRKRQIHNHSISNALGLHAYSSIQVSPDTLIKSSNLFSMKVISSQAIAYSYVIPDISHILCQSILRIDPS